MGIRDTMQPAFGKLFDTVFAEAVSEFTGTYLGTGIYDPVTEEDTAQQITYTGRGVQTKFKAEQIDNVLILATDTLLIALCNEVSDIPAAGHDIQIKDLVTGQVKSYDLKSVTTDPARVHYQLQLRAV